MYTEEFEEEEKGPRTYVSHFSQQDAEKLARENEKLKKSLEKEKFFNKLLDQELKEVKAESAAKYPAEYQARNGVSKGAFYSLLFLTLAMAAFIFYTLYNNKQYNLFNNQAGYTPTPVNQQSSTEQAQDLSTNSEPPPAVRDSVPNIIGNTNNTVAQKKTEEVKKLQPVAAPKEEEYNEAEVEAALQEPVNDTRTSTPKTTANAQPRDANTSDANTETNSATTELPAVEEQQPPVPQQPSRPVIARYRVTSKANFYNAADENTLRSAFISAGPNKIVEALEDKDGFIYVEYVNDRGMVSKGWLSKKDLTKSE
jgi:serine/threonine-protein kinase